MRIFLIALFCLIFPPSRIKISILRFFGWDICKDAYIGFSFIKVQKKVLFSDLIYIGHLNYIDVPCFVMKHKAYIKHANKISGPIYLLLKEYAAIGSHNRIYRAEHPISWGHSMLKIGENSKITVKHNIDCTRPITVGSNSIIAGQSTQLWTHGYIHNSHGTDRFRVDGSIKIGNNVYIGSAVIINPGISIGNAITVGSNVTVSNTLKAPGLYVNQALRFIPIEYNEMYKKHAEVKANGLIEPVVHKRSRID